MLKMVRKKIIYTIIFIFTLSNMVLAKVYESPLFESVKNMDLSKTRQYINSGYAVNITDENGNTPLTYAIRNEDYDIMITLLQAGADPAMEDETEYPIYCTGKVSNSNRIRLFFQNYDDTKCPKIVKKNDYRASNTTSFLSLINWTNIGGTLLTGGLIAGVAIASSNSDSSTNNGSGGGGSNPEIVTPETVLSAEQVEKYNNILAGNNTNGVNYYSGYNFSVQGSAGSADNTDIYNAINLAYGWARGFDGSINSNSVLSSSIGYPNAFTDDVPTGTSTESIGTNMTVAVVDSGVFNNAFITDNIASNGSSVSQNQLYEYYNTSCNGTFCEIYGTSSNPVYVNCSGSGTTLTCNLYNSADAGSIIAGSSFSLSQNSTTPINSNSTHGTWVSDLIVGNPVQDTSNSYIGFSGIAPNAEILPYVIGGDFSVDGGTFSTFADFKHIGNAYLGAGENGAVAINNSWGTDIAWNSNSSGGEYYVANGDTITINQSGTNYDIDDFENYLYYYYGDNTAGSSYIHSTDYTESNFLNSMKTVVNDNDSIFVFSAGNMGQANPSLENLIPLYLTNADGTKKTFYNETTKYYENFITVVAYDTSTNSLWSGSNQCGIAKNYCLTAPGANIIISDVMDDNLADPTFTSHSGTSFSAPIVSGAIALIKSAYPYLTGAEITKLLFITAKDLGAPGVDEVYGWGMIDLESATRPYGYQEIAVGSSINTASFSLSESKIKLNSLVANTIKSENLNFVVLDSFNRTFNANLNDFIESEKDRVNTIDILNNFATKSNLISLNKNGNLNFYYMQGQNKVKNSLSQEMELSYTVDKSNINNDYGFSLYYGNNPYNVFIDNKVDFYNNFSLSNSYNYNALNPYFKTNSDKNFAFNNLFKLNDKTILNLGILSQSYVIDYDKYYENRKETEELGDSLSFLAGLDYNINDNLSTKVELGFINEYDTLFGSKWSGAFGLGSNNTTYFTSVSSNLNLLNNNKLSLIGKMNFGYTDVNSIENSLIKDISNLYTSSYAIGINYNFDSKLKDEKSNISFLISQPVNIQNGSLNISLPTSRDNDGNIYYTNHKINLNGEKETNYQLTYNYSLGEDTSFNLGAIYRDYIDNEAIFLLKYKKNF